MKEAGELSKVEEEKGVEEEEVGGGKFGEIGEPPSQRAPAAGDAVIMPLCCNSFFKFISR